MKRREFIITGAMVPVGMKVETLAGVLDSVVHVQPSRIAPPGVNSLWSRPMYFRRNGTPIWYGPGEANAHRATIEWARLFEDFDNRRVRDTTLPNGIRVSTVWLGLNHAFDPKATPEIFESMAFAAEMKVHKGGEGSLFTRDFEYHEELGCERYGSEEEAIRGHMGMCERFFAGSLTLGGIS